MLLQRVIVPVILCVLGYGLWVSTDFRQIAAGVAIFLFGVLAMEEGFRTFTGGVLERLLRATTDTRWKSLVFGIVTTSLMQSSSLVSVIAISFLSAGLISLVAGICIIFGANLGTTTGVWLIAGFGLKVSISTYAMPMLVFGIVLILQSSKSLKGLGYVLAGFGFLFLGIHYMKEGFEEFRQVIELRDYARTGLEGLVVFVALGTAATVIMQSSHATLVLTITALATAQLTYENAIALAIGANIGTTITALLGSMGANIEGKRLAVAHLVFNAVTGAVAIAFITQLVLVVEFVSDAIGFAADSFTMKLAVFHSLFNLIGVVVMFPLIDPLVRLLQRVVRAPGHQPGVPLFLSHAASELPDAAVEVVRRETLHLFENVFEIFSQNLGIPSAELHSNRNIEELVTKHRTPADVDVDASYERSVKPLYAAIVAYISRSRGNVTPNQAEELSALRDACRYLVESVKAAKHLQKNLSRHSVSPRPELSEQYDGIRRQLVHVLREAIRAAHDTADALTALSLDEAKLGLTDFDVELNMRLDELIRNGRIDPKMATSLLNDSHYMHEAGTNLLNVGQILSSLAGGSQRSAIEQMTLDEADVRGLLNSHRRTDDEGQQAAAGNRGVPKRKAKGPAHAD